MIYFLAYAVAMAFFLYILWINGKEEKPIRLCKCDTPNVSEYKGTSWCVICDRYIKKPI